LTYGLSPAYSAERALEKKAAWLIGIIFFAVVGWIVWNNAGPRYTKKNLASTKHNKV
jgi:hypothetical protein